MRALLAVLAALVAKKLAVNAHGVVAIVNSSLEPGARSRIWPMRGR